MTTLHYVGIGAAVLVVGNGLLQMRKGKPFLSLGDSEVYQGGYTVKTADFNRRGQVRGNWRIPGLQGGLSSHQVRFGEAARSCSGRGQSQFRSCMSRSLRGR